MLISNEYGMVFKQIREQKQLALSYFKKVGIPKSCLSKFEHGESMMRFDRVVLALQAMNVSLEEYELIMNRFVPDFQEVFLDQLEKAHITHNLDKLKKLHEEAQNLGNPFLTLATKANLVDLTASEMNKIVDYLTQVVQWGYFELSLTSIIIEHMDSKEILLILENFKAENEKYYNHFKYRRKIYQIIFSALLKLGSDHEKAAVAKIMSQLPKNELNGIDFYTSITRILTFGFIKYCFDNEKDGKNEMLKALTVLEKLGEQELRLHYEQRITKFLGKDFFA